MPYTTDTEGVLKIETGVLQHAQQAFDKGDYIEAIAIVHAGLEFMLNTYFYFFTSFKLKLDKPYQKHGRYFYSFDTLKEVLYDMGELTESEYCALSNLNDARNKITHHMFRQFYDGKKPINVKRLPQALNDGKKVLEVLMDKLYIDVIGVEVPEDIKKKGRPYIRVPIEINWKIPKNQDRRTNKE